MSFSRAVLFSCLAFAVGISGASLLQFPKSVVLGFFILGLFPTLVLIFKYKSAAVFGILLIFFVLGIWRYQTAEQNVLESPLLTLNDTEQEISFVGIVAAELDVRDTNTKLEIRPHTIAFGELRGRPEKIVGKGKILVTLSRYPEYEYGDKLRLTGKLQTPIEFEDFNYRDYLKKDGIYSVMYWPKIEALNSSNYRGPNSIIYGKILGIKDKLRSSIYQNLSPPQSAILGSMLLGDKSRMSKDLKEKLNLAGVRHITAISGMHVAIITVILMSLLVGIGLWRQQAFYVTISIIAVFIIMTGLQPSQVRTLPHYTLFGNSG